MKMWLNWIILLALLVGALGASPLAGDPVVSASATGGAQDGGYSESYTYDSATGNLSSKAGTSYTYGDTNHDHAVTQVGSNTYAYDANGNMTSRTVGGQAYTLGYDAEGHLVSVSGAATATFIYDGDGQRVISTIGTTTTGFVGDHTEWVVGAANQPTRYYNAGGMRLATRLDGVMYYPLTDHLGSTGMTTDANGYEVAEIRYKAWGESRYTWNTTPTKHQYTGQYSNVSDFGLMYYNARWYDSTLGRFTSADTIVPQPGVPQSWDRYAYSSNNPINYIDPTGHWIEIALDFAFIVYDVYDVAANGLTWGSGLALAADIVCAILPIATGGGAAIRAFVKAGEAADAVVDTVKLIDKVDDAVDLANHSDDLVDAISHADEIVDTYTRPSGFRKGIRDTVWDAAMDADGVVRDPGTGEIMSITEPWDMGHKPGYEFRNHQASASERGISRKEFLNEYNDPTHYRPELPSSNRSHRYENITGEYFGY